MSIEEEKALMLEDANAISATGFVTKVLTGIRQVCSGWRAPARHDHDEEDAAEAKADAAVTAALERGREKARGEG